jgi:CRISPR-associated protein Cas1
MDKLELIFLQGFGINISVALQLRMAELDIPMVFAPPVGEPLAVLNPIGSRRAFLRGRQVLRRDDPDVVKGGLDMIASKVGNQSAVLQYFSKYKKRGRQKISEGIKIAAEEIRILADNIRMLDPSQATIRSIAMGFEGHAASIYWRQFGLIMPEGLGFRGRVTKSASDPVNQCLNYTYGMLYGEVWRAIAKEGLDPYFGIMHGAERNNGSLVFDLIEEFRAPFADRVVLGMLGRGFQPEIGDHGFLKTKAKRQLAISFSKRWSKDISWRSQKVTPDAILGKQAKSLAGLFNGAGVYHPFKMRW